MNIMEDITLSPAGIDKVSLHCGDDLTEAGVDKKEILRLRLAVEEILGVWLERLGGAEMKCKTVRNFFGNYVEIAVEGPRIDIQEGIHDRQFLFVNKLIAKAAIAPVYSYGDGLNVLTIRFPKEIKIGQTAQLFIAVAAAVICGCVGRALLPADAQSGVFSIAKMLFIRMDELFVAIESLLVFFTVCNSITSIGNLSLFGRIGLRTVNILLLVSLLSGVLFVSVFCIFIPIEGLNGGGVYINGINEIVKLLVDILPPDVVSPFINCNIVQIIFLGITLGVIILWCGDRTAGVRGFTEESGEIMLTAMNFYLRYIPFFVFLSVLNLVFMEVSDGIAIIAAMFLLCIAAYHLLLFIYFFITALFFRIKPAVLFKKLLHIYLMGFSSCSYEVPWVYILENAGEIIGVKKPYSDFAISMSGGIFYPVGVVSYLIYAIVSAWVFNISINPHFLITVVMFSFFLSLSGSAAMMPILFLQLGIPEEALSAVFIVDSIIYYFECAALPVCWLLGSLFCAGVNGMLDKDVLRSNVDLSASD